MWARWCRRQQEPFEERAVGRGDRNAKSQKLRVLSWDLCGPENCDSRREGKLTSLIASRSNRLKFQA